MSKIKEEYSIEAFKVFEDFSAQNDAMFGRFVREKIKQPGFLAPSEPTLIEKFIDLKYPEIKLIKSKTFMRDLTVYMFFVLRNLQTVKDRIDWSGGNKLFTEYMLVLGCHPKYGFENLCEQYKDELKFIRIDMSYEDFCEISGIESKVVLALLVSWFGYDKQTMTDKLVDGAYSVINDSIKREEIWH